jgi:uncharacterized protein
MIKKIVFQQKEELVGLMEPVYIDRLSPADKEKYLSTRLIKLISGPRRAGKSVFALQLLQTKNFGYLNFDDDLLLKNFNEDAVIQALSELYPGFEYLLLDEVQNLPNWELWVNKLHRRGLNLVITGSNARLLSHEMASSLTGRFVQITIYPFSFSEVLKFKKIEIAENSPLTPENSGYMLSLLNTYMSTGGYPEIALNPAIQKNYLSSLFDSILFKDIVRRFRVRQTQQFYDLSQYLLANYTNPWTYNQLSDDLNLSSVATTQKFIGFLAEPYLFITLTRYATKIRLHQRSPKKSFIVDNGFIQARSFELSPNHGRLLENVVFIELLRRGLSPGLDLFYYRTQNNREVDFLSRKGHKIDQLIQVCYDISSKKTVKRELDALIESSKELNCENLLIITWDRDEILNRNGLEIRLQPACKWLTLK